MLKNLLFFLLILSSCSLYNEPDCESKDFGKSELFASTRKMFDIYKNKKRAIFRDSLGNKDTFTVIYENYFDRAAEWTGVENCRAEKFYLFERINIKFSHKNYIHSFQYNCNYLRKEIANLNSERADAFNCITNKKSNSYEPIGVFYFVRIDENKPFELKIKKLLGKEYPTIKPVEGENLFYITEKEGVIALKIPNTDDRLWVLEKLE